MSGFTNDYLFGVVWDRQKLRLRDRCMITVATLAALGWERNLATHMRGALKAGVTQDEIIEMMIHIAHYAGWPAGMTGLRIAEEIFAEPNAGKK
jgi:4-carboxymuconolactone decarboxylase